MPELLDLAMIGTIGDMVKVTGEGHVIVKRGLEVLNQTERPGLRALIKNAGLTLGSINETDIGFNIAPRLNAVGRLANANLAVELLLSDDDVEAQKIADQIEELNNQRKELTTEVYDKCMALIRENSWQKQNTLVLYDPDFHEGVLGLVANKIVEKTHKPTIVLTKNQAGEIKGSGRSITGFNLFDALNPLKEELFTKFGGHDFACGLSMTEDKIGALREKLEKGFHVEGGLEIKEYDMELPLQGLSPQTLAQINQVGPFGTGDAQPIFSISNPTITQFFKIGKEKNHVKFNVAKKGGSLAVIGFNKDFLNNNLFPFIARVFVQLSLNTYRNKISLQGIIEGIEFASAVIGFNKDFLNNNLFPFIARVFVQLSLNTYRNKISLQGIIEGIEFASPKLAVPTPVIDLRQEKLVMGFADRYLLFDKKNIPIVRNRLQVSDDKISLVKDYDKSGETVALLDVPHNQIELNSALEKNYQQIYLRFLLDQLPVEHIPAKSYFGKVLKYIYAHPTLSPDDYRTVAPYLGLDYDSVLFILRVFFELGFVKLDDGKLVGEQHPQKQPLTASKYLRATQSQIKFVDQLRTMPTQQIITYVNNFLNN